jgi:hypothetical protein
MALPTDAAGYLRFLAPPLYALGADGYDYWISDADASIDTAGATWGVHRLKAVALLAAHRWSMSLKQTPTAVQAVGPITAESATNPLTQKGLSRSYGAIVGIRSTWEADLSRTEYGLQLLALVQSRPHTGSRLTGLPSR